MFDGAGAWFFKDTVAAVGADYSSARHDFDFFFALVADIFYFFN